MTMKNSEKLIEWIEKESTIRSEVTLEEATQRRLNTERTVDTLIKAREATRRLDRQRRILENINA